MVFVWSYLSDGDPAYTLVQVSVNDLIMLVLFAPIVRFLVSGASNLEVPFQVLLMSVLVFIVIPLAIGVLLRQWFVRTAASTGSSRQFLPRFQPVAITALLVTLVLIFAFQADNLLNRPLHIALIAIPILIQVYFNSSLTYGLMRLSTCPTPSPHRGRSSARATSSSWRWRPRSPSSAPSRARPSPRSWASWWKCR